MGMGSVSGMGLRSRLRRSGLHGLAMRAATVPVPANRAATMMAAEGRGDAIHPKKAPPKGNTE